MAVKSRRSYKGAPVSNTLGIALSAGATTVTLASAMSGWPTGSEPFFIVIDPGTAKEEKLCVVYTSTTQLTVVDPAATSGWTASAAGRGADDTTDRNHDAGAVVYPVFTALEANQANELVSKYSAQGAIVYQGASTFTTLTVGTAGQVLKVNSGATAPEWGQVATAGIADSSVTLAKLAAVMQAALPPVGTIVAYGGAVAPTGWLLCDGSTFNATTYSSLNTVLGGNTLPDLRARVPMGKAASGTGSTLLGTGGARKIASSNLPTHAHALDHDHAAFNWTHDHAAFDTADGGSHTHTITDPGHAHFYASAGYGTKPMENVADSSVSYANGNTIETTPTNFTNISINSTNSAHKHSIDVPSHTGSIDIPAFTGTVTTTFANDDYFQPFVAVNYIIKHDYV